MLQFLRIIYIFDEIDLRMSAFSFDLFICDRVERTSKLSEIQFDLTVNCPNSDKCLIRLLTLLLLDQTYRS